MRRLRLAAGAARQTPAGDVHPQPPCNESRARAQPKPETILIVAPVRGPEMRPARCGHKQRNEMKKLVLLVGADPLLAETISCGLVADGHDVVAAVPATAAELVR